MKKSKSKDTYAYIKQLEEIFNDLSFAHLYIDDTRLKYHKDAVCSLLRDAASLVCSAQFLAEEDLAFQKSRVVYVDNPDLPF